MKASDSRRPSARGQSASLIPPSSRVVVVTSLADRAALENAFSGADAVLSAVGVTSTSRDRPALLSANMDTVEQAMLAAGVDRIIVIDTLVALFARYVGFDRDRAFYPTV